MGKRTYKSDMIALALLYRKDYVGTDMLSYAKAVEFDTIINKNLDDMNSLCGIGLRCEEPSQLYNLMRDENGNVCAVIDPNADIEKAWELHFGCLPTDVVIASQMDNALKCIGLIMVDNKIVDRNEYYNELRVKHHLLREPYERPKFDVFRDWENVSQDGFVENYCISAEERAILNELRENKQKAERSLQFVKVIKK